MFTAFLIAVLIVAGAATVVGGGLVLAAQKRKALGPGSDTKLLTSGSSTDLLERGFSDIRVDDIVQADGRDYLVEGVILYEEAGHKWSMARIVDGRDSHWLLVGIERTGGASKRFMEHTDEIAMSGYPPEVLIHGDLRFEFDKRGTATAKLSGDTGTLGGNESLAPGAAHRCRWWLYSAPGDDSLLVEQWGDDYRVLIGRTMGDTDIDMMPAS